MAFSSGKRMTQSYLHCKENTYNYRQQRLNQVYCSNFSPSTTSVKFNQQSQYTKPLPKDLIHDLENKLQMELLQKNRLITQNINLNEMVNSLKIKDENQTVKIASQFTSATEELREHIRMKQAEVVMLLDEVQRLHDQCFKIQLVKNNQIKEISETHGKKLALQTHNMKKYSQDTSELLQLQIAKLRQSIQQKNYQYQSLKTQSKTQSDRLRSDLSQLRNQMKHWNQLKQLQVQQLNDKYKQYINTTSKQAEREQSIAISKLENKIKKMKFQLMKKNGEIQQAVKKCAVNAEEYQLEVQSLQEDRRRLLDEISQLETSNKQNIYKQKQRTKQLCQFQLKNMENKTQNQKSCLKNQITKLLHICKSKTEEIKKLLNNIDHLKEGYAVQKAQNQKLVDELRKRIVGLEQDNMEGIELLKVKMAQLHESDVKSLEQYYQNQIVVMAKQIKLLQEQHEEDRDKLHKSLQENDLLRKTFESQVTKYKAKIQDFKIKLTAANLEYREQITSFGTKIELTSQTLLREAEQKQKSVQFFQVEKKKFYVLIEGKDNEIATAYDNINRMKQMHIQQIKQLRSQIAVLRSNLTDKTNQFKQLKNDLQQQFQRKVNKIVQQKYQSPNQQIIRQNVQLKDYVQRLQQDVLAQTKQIQLLLTKNQSLQHEVFLRAGMIEAMQLQNLAIAEDEKQEIKMIVSQNQLEMKDYYQNKLASKEKDILGLGAQLSQKQHDIRQLIVKYNQLEKRLKELLESQERLSEFEKKIVNLGLDQNLVKNISQLFAKQRK